MNKIYEESSPSFDKSLFSEISAWWLGLKKIIYNNKSIDDKP